jgi:hypothetical protein
MKLTSVLIVLFTCLFLAGCASPAREAPVAITITDDLRFEATPPIGFPTRVYTITKGRYVLASHVMVLSHYASPDGMVSSSARGETPKPVPGGIGIDRSNGKYFIWKWDKSIGAVSLGAVTIHGEAGRDICVFLAGIPQEFRGNLQVE